MKIAILGVGYVGIHNVVNLAKKNDVIAFDINKEKIDKYNNGIDPTKEYGSKEISNCSAIFTCDTNFLKDIDMYIVCVPTDVDANNTPVLTPLVSASKLIAKNASKNAIVVYESTVYPGMTNEICRPCLECDYKLELVYTPERISPGDNISLDMINRVIGGDTEEAIDIVIDKYFFVPSFHKVASIEIAEAAKILENTQRDVNIALMNQLEPYFLDKNINIKEVIKAASTKWNFYEVYPGLVGGHCISVDPNYLIFDMNRNGFIDTIVHSSRKINEDRVEVVYNKYVRTYNKSAKLLFVGASYKKNTNDFRNSLNLKLMEKLALYFTNAIFFELNYEKNFSLSFNLENELNEVEVDTIVPIVNHDYLSEIKIVDGKVTYNNKFQRDV